MKTLMPRLMSALSLSFVAMATAASMAWAADEPNLVGKWKLAEGPDAYAGVIIKNPNDPNSKPVILKSEAFYEVIIEGQEGRAFHGKAIPPSKTPVIPLVGVIRLNRQEVVMSTHYGAYVGDIRGNLLDLCWFDTVADIIQVACTAYEKVK